MYEWYGNEWVHIMVKEPDTEQFFYLKNGQFVPYIPLAKSINDIQDMKMMVESAKEMETNYIVDATRENLPVYTIPK